jgi:pSer/pThr/pTyr-binding forkhead associated (FHA) protein
VAEDVPK